MLHWRSEWKEAWKETELRDGGSKEKPIAGWMAREIFEKVFEISRSVA